MRHFHERPAGRLAIASIAALVFAFVYLIHPAWDNERAHDNLTRALAQARRESMTVSLIPRWGRSTVRHSADILYAAKEPGLAGRHPRRRTWR